MALLYVRVTALSPLGIIDDDVDRLVVELAALQGGFSRERLLFSVLVGPSVDAEHLLFGRLLRRSTEALGDDGMRILEGRQVQGRKRRDHVLVAVFLDELVPALRELAYLLLAGVLGRREQVLPMGRELLEVLYLLLAVEHLPALDAEDFTVTLLFDQIKLRDERLPLGCVALDKLSLGWPLGAWLLHKTGLAAASVVRDRLTRFHLLLSAGIDRAAPAPDASDSGDNGHHWRSLLARLGELLGVVRVVRAFAALVNGHLILLVIHVFLMVEVKILFDGKQSLFNIFVVIGVKLQICLLLVVL